MQPQTSFQTWLEFLGGVLDIGFIGLIVSIIEQKRRHAREADAKSAEVEG